LQRYRDNGMTRCFWVIHDEANVHMLTHSLSV
jgi:hypothetical protein